MRTSSGFYTLLTTGPEYNLAFPLVNKGARDVAEALEKCVFPVVGLPSILHSDNGREFVIPCDHSDA